VPRRYRHEADVEAATSTARAGAEAEAENAATGSEKDLAETVQAASVLVYADCRGIPSHGVNRADFYASEIASGAVDGTATPIVERDSGSCATINGRNGLGTVVARAATDLAIEKAKEHGVGWVVARRSNHFGAAGFWAELALEQGFIGFALTNTAPFMVPTGGSARAVGTNPISCFAPGAGGDSYQLDMATTSVPIGKVEVMARLDRPLPHGWGVDGAGQPCTDAVEVRASGGLTPLGGYEETAGYKGYGLGMLVELLCGVLSGANVGPGVPPWVPERGTTQMDMGHCFIALDPARFGDGFRERLSDYQRTMRGQPGEVIVPGDPEKKFEEAAAAQGVLLHAEVAASVKRLAERFGVEAEVPAVMR
jgi:LDH2 family malate/lactate/ureidoglycolate dehydrogenase